tara:strand:- start:834 stop:953 length:120 start_codon:yes stop_codon:yes gene_type:complete
MEIHLLTLKTNKNAAKLWFDLAMKMSDCPIQNFIVLNFT